jgi:transposase-like protein/lambda repressor-like predicted transcriptional regulator
VAPAPTGTITRSCPTCGFTRTYRSQAQAAHYFSRHSCATQQRLAAIARARAEREAGGRRRDCEHPGHPHEHGTLLAYQKDECRCLECRAANAAATRLRNRELTYGRWSPLVNADLVRAHIARLRSTGLGVPRIAELAGVSERWLRQIVHGDKGQLQAHVRADTARRLLAVDAERANLAPNRKIDGTGTRRRLQALVALGWPPAWIAERLGRDRANFRQALFTDEVTARTAGDVAALYNQLWNTRPKPETPRGERAVADALAMAAQRQWLTPMAWDDIDTDPEPPTPPSDALDDIDEIAIELALGGHSIRLSQLPPTEQDEVVRRLTENGKSVRDIAEQLATSTRTVSRRRRISAA